MGLEFTEMIMAIEWEFGFTISNEEAETLIMNQG